MILTDKLQKAINLCAELHHGQMRKGRKLPYVVHLFSVAIIVSEYTDNEDLIIAALLHDVFEDTQGYNEEDMNKDFGPRVVACVKTLTEDKDLPWMERKKDYLERVIASDKENFLICVADKIHNLNSINRAYLKEVAGQHQDSEARFKRTKDFYLTIAKAASQKLGDHPIVSRLEEAYLRAEKTFNEYLKELGI
ncbi:MAG: HD domain-containing protein [Patescibacteria group bacterium]|nr:MAG: HD domain-containing protein [Patescibacteria group bacterium]